MVSNPQQFPEQVLPCSEEQVDISQKCTKSLSNSLTVIHETVLVLSSIHRHCLTESKDCSSDPADSHSIQKKTPPKFRNFILATKIHTRIEL